MQSQDSNDIIGMCDFNHYEIIWKKYTSHWEVHKSSFLLGYTRLRLFYRIYLKERLGLSDSKLGKLEWGCN